MEELLTVSGLIQDISLVKKTAEIRKDNGKSEGCGG